MVTKIVGWNPEITSGACACLPGLKGFLVPGEGTLLKNVAKSSFHGGYILF